MRRRGPKLTNKYSTLNKYTYLLWQVQSQKYFYNTKNKIIQNIQGVTQKMFFNSFLALKETFLGVLNRDSLLILMRVVEHTFWFCIWILIKAIEKKEMRRIIDKL